MQNQSKQSRAAGSYLCLLAALVALATGILFLATQAKAAPLGHTGNLPGLVLLAGAALGFVLFFFPVRFSALLETILYNIALYLVVVQLYFVFADLINHVTFAGGNALLCVVYMGGALVATLLSLIACFLRQETEEAEQMAKKRGIPVLVSLVLIAALFCGGLFLTGEGLPFLGKSEAGGPAVMKYADNSFVAMSLEDLSAIPQETWQAKEANGEVAYFFEGQYTEGFSTIVDPACLDMYLCKDGSMYGSFSGPDTSVGMNEISLVYGYWYNVDQDGNSNFVIHLVGNKDQSGALRPVDTAGGADEDIFIFDSNHGSYGWEASMSYGVMNGMFTRNINIYGQEYTPAQSLAIDNSKLRTFYTGDAFDPSELTVSAVRGSGDTESIWSGRLAYAGYDSETTGTKTLTGSFLGASAEFEVQVEELVTENYAGSYELVVGDAPVAMDAVVLIDYSHRRCSVTAADGSAFIGGDLVEEKEGALILTLNGSAPMECQIKETPEGKVLSIPAHQEVVAGWGFSSTYDIGEGSFVLEG